MATVEDNADIEGTIKGTINDEGNSITAELIVYRRRVVLERTTKPPLWKRLFEGSKIVREEIQWKRSSSFKVDVQSRPALWHIGVIMVLLGLLNLLFVLVGAFFIFGYYDSIKQTVIFQHNREEIAILVEQQEHSISSLSVLIDKINAIRDQYEKQCNELPFEISIKRIYARSGTPDTSDYYRRRSRSRSLLPAA